MLKCSNILNGKLLIMVIYFYKKCILQRTLLMSGGTTFKERVFFAQHKKFRSNIKRFQLIKLAKAITVLIFEAEIERKTFIVLNLFNSQLQPLSDVVLLLSDFSPDDTKKSFFWQFQIYFLMKN